MYSMNVHVYHVYKKPCTLLSDVSACIHIMFSNIHRHMMEGNNDRADTFGSNQIVINNETFEMEGVSSNEVNMESDVTTNDSRAQKHFNTSFDHSTQEKIYTLLSFLCLILVVVGVMLIPITLFYTNPSSYNFTVTTTVDLESCSVSNTYISVECTSQ